VGGAVPPAASRLGRLLGRGLAGNRDFVRLWATEAVSRVGTQVSFVAIPLTAVFTLHAHAGELGLIGAAQFAPALLVTPLAGLWSDTHRRRPVLLAANWGRAVALGSIPLLYELGWLRIELLAVAAFVTGAFTAAFDVAYLSYVPLLVAPEELTDANAALQASYSGAQVVGPGLGGLLVQALGAPVAVLADALSYAVAALGLHRIERREPARPRAEPEPVRARLAAGLRATFGDRYLAPLALESAWFNLFEQVILTLYPLYATRTLGLSAGVLGATLSVGSLGALAGSLAARRLGDRLGLGRASVLAVALSSAAPALILLAGHGVAAAAPFLLLAFAAYGFGLTVFNVHATTFRQRAVPDELLGRITASWRLVSYGTIPLGSVLAGGLGATVGVRATIATACVALVAGAVVFALSPVARLRAGAVVSQS
jgi:MFS family permease